MVAATVPLVIKQGSVFNAAWTWTHPDPDDPTIPGIDPFLLTNYTARAQIRKAQQDIEGMVEFTTTTGGIILNETPGLIRVYLKATDTDILSFKKMFWDLELIPPDGGGAPDPVNAFAIMEGAVKVIPNYTQTTGQVILQ